MSIHILNQNDERSPTPPPETPGIVVASLNHYEVHRRNPFPSARYLTSGSIRCTALGRNFSLNPGELLVLGAGVEIDMFTDSAQEASAGIGVAIDPGYFGAGNDALFLKVDPTQFGFGKILENVSQRVPDFLSGKQVERLGMLECALNNGFKPMVRQIVDNAGRIECKSLATSLPLLEKVHMAGKQMRYDLFGIKSLEDFACQVGLSKYHFARVFKAVYGVAPIVYRDRERLKSARCQLIKGAPVQEVAYRFGYSEPPSFSKAFKRCFGMPPSVFQSKLRRQ